MAEHVLSAEMEARWQVFAAALRLNMEEPSEKLKAHGVTARYKYQHTGDVWEAWCVANGALPADNVRPCAEVIEQVALMLTRSGSYFVTGKHARECRRLAGKIVACVREAGVA